MGRSAQLQHNTTSLGAQRATLTHTAGRSSQPEAPPQPAPSNGPGRGHSHELARAASSSTAASPNLLTGGRAAQGTEGSRAGDTHPKYRAVMMAHCGQDKQQHRNRPKPWLQGGLGHRTTLLALLCPKEKKKGGGEGGQDRKTITPLMGLSRNTPLAACIKSCIPPWKVKAKLHPFSGRPKRKAQSLCQPLQMQTRKGNIHIDTTIQKGTQHSQRPGKNPDPRAADKNL